MPTPSSIRELVANERRLHSLRETALLDSLPEEGFDRLVRLATRLTGAPVALLSLVDEHRQFFKSAIGLPEPWASLRETPLSHSFCQYTLASPAPFVVEDARSHPIVHQNEAIDDLGVHAYAGIPLITKDGNTLGSFCAIDQKPRTWTETELNDLRDLAAIAMTEIELRLHEQHYRMLADNATDMISMHTLAGEYSYVSKACQSLLGFAPSDLLGINAYDLFHPDDIGLIQESHTATLLDRSKATKSRYRIRRKDGTYCWVETRGQVVEEEGQAPHIVAVTRDISEQKVIEQSLQIERERFHTLTEVIPQHVWTALPTGELDYVNSQVNKFFGLTSDEVIGQGWQEVIHPDDLADVVRCWTHSLKTGAPYQVEFRLRTQVGIYTWHLARAVPMRAPDGTIVKWFGTNTDISEHKQMEEELRLEKSRLAELLDELRRVQHDLVQQEKLAGLGRLAAGVAHEMKNPLNFIVNFGEIAEDLATEARALRATDEALSELLDDLILNTQRIVHHGRRADEIARSMLAHSRDVRGKRLPTRLNGLLNECIDLACAEWRLKIPALEIESSFDDAIPPLLLNQDAIKQVFLNLLRNGLDALNNRLETETPAYKPRLYLKTQSSPNGEATVYIQDNGTGMPPEVADRIFEPFYTTKGPDQGTGLGLSLAYTVVTDVHQGNISVRSREGEGSIFSITLPAPSAT